MSGLSIPIPNATVATMHCAHVFMCVHICVYVRRTDRQTDRQTDRYMYLKFISEELVMSLFPPLTAQTSVVLATVHTSIWIGMHAIAGDLSPPPRFQ